MEIEKCADSNDFILLMTREELGCLMIQIGVTSSNTRGEILRTCQKDFDTYGLKLTAHISKSKNYIWDPDENDDDPGTRFYDAASRVLLQTKG